MAGEVAAAKSTIGTIGKWVGRGALLFAFALACDAVLPGSSPIVQQVANVGGDLTGAHYAQMIPAGLGKAATCFGDVTQWAGSHLSGWGTPSIG